VPAQAKACGYIYTNPHVPISAKSLPDTTAFEADPDVGPQKRRTPRSAPTVAWQAP